jgi:Zn-dependent membrane protease YugP
MMSYQVSGADYAYFFANNMYWVALIPIFLISLWAQIQVSSNFRRYSAVGNRRHLTGAEAASAVLRANGVRDVAIRCISGNLTDHYDPRDNTISLSESVYSATTIAAVGVAAHEAGHAVQYAEGYTPIRIRGAIVPATQIGSKFSFILLILGLILYSQPLFLVGIILFSLTTVFQLVTLPVEFNASHRALKAIEGQQLLDSDETEGARKVLRAAAMTYVAALLMSLLQLLRYLLIFFARGGGRRDGSR